MFLYVRSVNSSPQGSVDKSWRKGSKSPHGDLYSSISASGSLASRMIGLLDAGAFLGVRGRGNSNDLSHVALAMSPDPSHVSE